MLQETLSEVGSIVTAVLLGRSSSVAFDCLWRHIRGSDATTCPIVPLAAAFRGSYRRFEARSLPASLVILHPSSECDIDEALFRHLIDSFSMRLIVFFDPDPDVVENVGLLSMTHGTPIAMAVCVNDLVDFRKYDLITSEKVDVVRWLLQSTEWMTATFPLIDEEFCAFFPFFLDPDGGSEGEGEKLEGEEDSTVSPAEISTKVTQRLWDLISVQIVLSLRSSRASNSPALQIQDQKVKLQMLRWQSFQGNSAGADAFLRSMCLVDDLLILALLNTPDSARVDYALAIFSRALYRVLGAHISLGLRLLSKRGKTRLLLQRSLRDLETEVEDLEAAAGSFMEIYTASIQAEDVLAWYDKVTSQNDSHPSDDVVDDGDARDDGILPPMTFGVAEIRRSLASVCSKLVCVPSFADLRKEFGDEIKAREIWTILLQYRFHEQPARPDAQKPLISWRQYRTDHNLSLDDALKVFCVVPLPSDPDTDLVQPISETFSEVLARFDCLCPSAVAQEFGVPDQLLCLPLYWIPVKGKPSMLDCPMIDLPRSSHWVSSAFEIQEKRLNLVIAGSGRGKSSTIRAWYVRLRFSHPSQNVTIVLVFSAFRFDRVGEEILNLRRIYEHCPVMAALSWALFNKLPDNPHAVSHEIARLVDCAVFASLTHLANFVVELLSAMPVDEIRERFSSLMMDAQRGLVGLGAAEVFLLHYGEFISAFSVISKIQDAKTRLRLVLRDNLFPFLTTLRVDALVDEIQSVVTRFLVCFGKSGHLRSPLSPFAGEFARLMRIGILGGLSFLGTSFAADESSLDSPFGELAAGAQCVILADAFGENILPFALNWSVLTPPFLPKVQEEEGERETVEKASPSRSSDGLNGRLSHVRLFQVWADFLLRLVRVLHPAETGEIRKNAVDLVAECKNCSEASVETYVGAVSRRLIEGIKETGDIQSLSQSLYELLCCGITKTFVSIPCMDVLEVTLRLETPSTGSLSRLASSRESTLTLTHYYAVDEISTTALLHALSLRLKVSEEDRARFCKRMVENDKVSKGHCGVATVLLANLPPNAILLAHRPLRFLGIFLNPMFAAVFAGMQQIWFYPSDADYVVVVSRSREEENLFCVSEVLDCRRLSHPPGYPLKSMIKPGDFLRMTEPACPSLLFQDFSGDSAGDNLTLAHLHRRIAAAVPTVTLSCRRGWQSSSQIPRPIFVVLHAPSSVKHSDLLFPSLFVESCRDEGIDVVTLSLGFWLSKDREESGEDKKTRTILSSLRSVGRPVCLLVCCHAYVADSVTFLQLSKKEIDDVPLQTVEQDLPRPVLRILLTCSLLREPNDDIDVGVPEATIFPSAMSILTVRASLPSREAVSARRVFPPPGRVLVVGSTTYPKQRRLPLVLVATPEDGERRRLISCEKDQGNESTRLYPYVPIEDALVSYVVDSRGSDIDLEKLPASLERKVRELAFHSMLWEAPVIEGEDFSTLLRNRFSATLLTTSDLPFSSAACADEESPFLWDVLGSLLEEPFLARDPEVQCSRKADGWFVLEGDAIRHAQELLAKEAFLRLALLKKVVIEKIT